MSLGEQRVCVPNLEFLSVVVGTYWGFTFDQILVRIVILLPATEQT